MTFSGTLETTFFEDALDDVSEDGLDDVSEDGAPKLEYVDTP
jgi:hypothetical protein